MFWLVEPHDGRLVVPRGEIGADFVQLSHDEVVWTGHLRKVLRSLRRFFHLQMHLGVVLQAEEALNCAQAGDCHLSSKRIGVRNECWVKALKKGWRLPDTPFFTENLADQFGVSIADASLLGYLIHLLPFRVQAHDFNPLLVRDTAARTFLVFWHFSLMVFSL